MNIAVKNKKKNKQKNKDKVLVINAGSSSIKYSLIEITEQNVIASGSIENIGEIENSPTNFSNHQQGLEYIFSELKNRLLLTVKMNCSALVTELYMVASTFTNRRLLMLR